MMNTLKLLAFLKAYITYIFQVRVKHYLSTDIVLITQNLRKKIIQGKTYFTGTSILLKKRCKIGVQNQIKTAGSSGSLRVLFGDLSTLRRTNVAPSSGVHRLLFGCSSGRTRSAVEAVPKPSRSVPEHVSNMSRRSPEAESKATRRGVGASLSSDFFLTNFAPTSAFHAMGLGCSSNFPLIFPEGDPKPTRRNSEQRWEKGRSWSGIGRIVVCCLAAVFQSSNYSFKVLKSIKALALLTLMVSMFSLSAQTPRKDSGANGLSPVKALNIGDKIPQSLWDTPLQVVNHPTGQKTIKLSEYRSKKLIILDFWAVWCASCVESLGKIQHKLRYDHSDIVFIPVTLNADTVVTKFQHSNKVAGEWKFPLVVGDKLLKQLFQHSSISHFVWLSNDGTVLAFTSSEYITDSQLQKGLKGDFADVKMKIDQIDFDPQQPLLVSEQANLKARYSGFSGFIAGVTPTSGIKPMERSALKRSYMVNTTLRSLCLNAMAGEKGIQLSKKKIVYDVDDEDIYFNKSKINTDVWNQKHGLCYEAILPERTIPSAFRAVLKEDLQRFYHIYLTIEEQPISVLTLNAQAVKSTISADESIELKSIINTLNLTDNAIPYVVCPADMEQVGVPKSLKECTSVREFTEMMAKCSIKVEQRKENHQVLVIRERRGV